MIPHLPVRRLIIPVCSVLLTCAAGFSQTLVSKKCSHMLYRGEYAEAAQLAQRYLKQHPTDVPVRVLLGRAELAQGRFLPAFEELHKALAIDPGNIDALYYLSFTARALSDQEYQRLFAMKPDSARVHQLLAEAALSNQNPTQAETEFKKALDADPHSWEAATELAELKRSQSKFDEAIDYYTQAAKSGSLSYDIAYGLGACYTYKQEYGTADEWLRKAVKLAPDSPAGHFALGNALFQGGQVEAAIPELRTALRFEPRMKQAYFLLGRAYSKLGQKEEAAAAFKKLDELSGSKSPDGRGDSSSDAGVQKPTPK
jgi:tetratricopeptide (TPR) repeat protein